MHDTLKPALAALLQNRDLSDTECRAAIGAIMDGLCEPVEIAAFLTAMAAKGSVAAELVGAALAMRQRATSITSHSRPLLDTCGTGGDRLHTFNISTAAALVAASCGIAVAKHGNRGVSSSSGSADVLETLGVHISLSARDASQCLDDIGLAFCFAPLIHGAMKYAAPVRRQLGFPTIFNLLGPLTNPAGAEYQLLGAISIERAELLANALSQLNIQRAFVVCGNNELDEVSLWGATTVFDVRANTVSRQEWTASDFGLKCCEVASLRVTSASESAALILNVLKGVAGPATDMVVANSAAALVVSGQVDSLRAGVDAAAAAISAGKSLAMLEALIQKTRSLANSASQDGSTAGGVI
ncbi:MAG: anthranilate phosphoribosyltransferase [Planctomycetales bacterium]|nr:anthranilate phosphoribosyltransferase [Planctomycetales bacterium]